MEMVTMSGTQGRTMLKTQNHLSSRKEGYVTPSGNAIKEGKQSTVYQNSHPNGGRLWTYSLCARSLLHIICFLSFTAPSVVSAFYDCRSCVLQSVRGLKQDRVRANN